MRRTTLFEKEQQQTTPTGCPIDHGAQEPLAPDPMTIFLKLKPSFLILTQDEIAAKVLRIIEAYTERAIAKYHAPSEACFWVSISHEGFMDALWGTVQSETTLTGALEHLKAAFLIFERPGQGFKKTNAYVLNKPLIALLCSIIPKNMRDINMRAIMRKPRKVRNRQGQLLTPPPVDPLVQTLRDTINDPHNRQLLTPPPSIIDAQAKLNGGHLLTPKRDSKDTKKEKKEEAARAIPSTTKDTQPFAAATHFLTNDFNHVTRGVLLDLQQCIHRLLTITDEQTNEQPLACIPVTFPEETTDTSPSLGAQVSPSQEDELEQALPAGEVSLALPERSAPAVVELIERLRGRAYTASERPRELKAAFTLLNLAETPQLSLQEIREAWEHGSDDWWRARYGDDVHVHDLVQKDSQGRHRVLAFLEHKRKFARFGRTSDHAQTVPYVPVQDILAPQPEEQGTQESYELLTCEADAVSLANQIEHDGQAHGYDLAAHVEEDAYHPGVWFVDVEWLGSESRGRMHRVSSYAAWQRYFAQQHVIIQYNTVTMVPA